MAALAAARTPFAVATVVRTEGSTPQVVGARMLVSAHANERPSGTLGGGCVEADAILAARRIIATGGRTVHLHQLNEALAWNTGLVCGGTMWILVEAGDLAMTCGETNLLPRAVAAARGKSAMAVATMFARERQREMTFVGRAAVLAGGRVVGIARRRH